jgi:hypothetical protein
LKLSDWASVAEILSGIAVFVTLVFLLFGIRDNTEATRAATFAGTIDSLNEWRYWLASDDELREVWRIYTEGRYDELSPEQQYQISWAQGIIWFIYEKTYFADQYGQLGDLEWERTAQSVCRTYERMRETDLLDVIPTSTSEFIEYVNDSCGSE